MRRFFIVFITTFSIFLSFTPVNAADDTEDWIYTTRQGDTLWDLSRKYLNHANEWKKLKKYNQIPDHLRLHPGTRLKFPVNWLKNQPSPVFVESVTGNATYTTINDQIAKPLKAGSKLGIGTRIVTNQSSGVTLLFADKTRLFIQPQSQITLDSLSAHKTNGMVDTRIQLKRGRVESRVIPFKNKKSRYEIKTPAAVASVRGTTFRVSMNEASETMSSEVVSGKVAVASEGVTQLVSAGFGTRTIKGRPPEPARKLLSAPNLSNIPDEIRTRPVLFRWNKLKNAQQYRVQIAKTPQFKSILFNTTSEKPEATWNNDKPGKYMLRIRGIDQSGLEGKDASHEFSIGTEIPAPTPVFPADKGALSKDRVNFQWLAHSDATRFFLQVSSDLNFQNNVIEVSGNQLHYSARKPLKPGKYYWRVANEYANDIHSTFSKVQSFIVEQQNQN